MKQKSSLFYGSLILTQNILLGVGNPIAKYGMSSFPFFLYVAVRFLMGSLFPVAPELSMDTFWYYKNAHLIDQTWSVRACGVRQRHIDQAQSMNLYITNEYTFRNVLDLYLLAWECGVKTVYYIRSRSLEVEECDVCSS